MFNRESDILSNYSINKNTGAYRIAVSLDDYNDVYDDWDPAPFKKRDIELEFQDYIMDSSEDIPLKYDLELVLYVPLEKKEEKKEVLLRKALNNHFKFLKNKMMKEKEGDWKKAFSYVFMSFLLLTLGTLNASRLHGDLIMKIMNEGLVIGGWVFLWEAFSLLAFDLRRVQKRLKQYKRFLKADVEFSYLKTDK